MTDDEQWRAGVDAIGQELMCLAPCQLLLLKAGVDEMMTIKAAMHSFVEKLNGAVLCAACGGRCCVCGKYHFSAIDLLAYRLTDKELFQPSFVTGRCCFLRQDTCLMAPEFRPFNCVTFVCEEIEARMTVSNKAAFYAGEKKLRNLYGDLKQLFPDNKMNRSVMSYVQVTEQQTETVESTPLGG